MPRSYLAPLGLAPLAAGLPVADALVVGPLQLHALLGTPPGAAQRVPARDGATSHSAAALPVALFGDKFRRG